MADWEIDENGNLVKVSKGDTGINPTTDLPWGVYPDKGSPTGYTHTASGTPVYKDGAPWSGTTSNRAINVNVAAPVTWGPSQTDDGSVTGVPGAVYQINSRGDVSIISKPTATKPTASLWNDENGDGYDDQTGLPNGVTNIGGKLYFQGKRVNPDGSLYTGTDGGGKQAILIDRDGSVTGRAGTSYYYDETGTPHTLVTGTAQTTSSGGGSSRSSGVGSSGGSSAGGGLQARSGGYNNTNRTIREGGFTNTNISEIGPLEAAQRASEFAANNALARDKRQMELAALYSQQLRDTDPNAYQVFLEKLGGGRLDNALLSGGNALSQNALRGAATSLGALNGMNTPAQAGGGLQMTTGGGGLQLEGGGPASPGGGLPSAPAATPVPGAYQDDRAMTLANLARQGVMRWDTPEEYNAFRAATEQTPKERAYNELHAGEQGAIWGGDYGGQTDLSKYYGLTNGILSGRVKGTQTLDPSRAGYVAPVDPRIAAQATDDRQRDIAVLPYGDDDIQREIPQRAGGGLTRGPAIIGDPQANGEPNPEVIIPHDPRMTYDVVPLQDMDPMMAQKAMGGLQRKAYGTPEQLAYFSAHPEEDNPFAPAPQPVAQPVATQPAPVRQPSQPATTTTQPVQTAYQYDPTRFTSQPATTTTQPVQTAYQYDPTRFTSQPASHPAQIGTYSTAPGTAGQPVTQPATTPTAALISGASGGSTQPPQSAFDEVMYTRLAATNPWMSDPASYLNVDYLTRDPIARRNYEQWLTMRYGVPQESIDFAQARNRLGGASMASMSQGR